MQSLIEKRIILVLLILWPAVFLLAGCSSKPTAQWGKALKLGNTGTLYYTSDVTEDAARGLSAYFMKINTFQEAPPIVQLAKKGDVYQVRVVTDKAVLEKPVPPEVMGPVEAAGLLAEEISKTVFNGAKVEWHFCDDRFNTLRVANY